jgi:hypothetical protein
LLIKGVRQISREIIVPERIDTKSIKIKIINGTIEKGTAMKPESQITRMTEREGKGAEAEHIKHRKTTFQKFIQSPGVSEEEEGPARLGRSMLGK